MAIVSLSTLRTLVRELADHQTIDPTDAVLEDEEIDRRLNDGLSAFHDLMVEVQRHEWCVTQLRTATATLNPDLTSYTLAADTLLVVKVRVTDGNRWGDVEPFENDERAMLLSVTYGGDLGCFRYRVNGRQIEVLPPTSSAHTLHVDYVPEFEPLTTDVDTIACPYGWWRWPALLAAIAILGKEDRDPTILQQQWQFEDRRIRSLAGRRGTRGLRIVDRRRDGTQTWQRLPRLWRSD